MGGATILKVGGQILRAERIIPKLCPPVRFGSKSGGSCPPPSSYGSAAHGLVQHDMNFMLRFTMEYLAGESS